MLKSNIPSAKKLVASVNKASPLILTPSKTVSNEEPPIILEAHKNTRSIIFNRPKQLNPLNIPSLDMIFPALKMYEKSDEVDLVIVKGKGRALSAGGDVKFIVNAAMDSTKTPELDYYLCKAYELFHHVGTMKKPVVSVMNGIAMGYGLAISALPAFGIATENTQICMPETRFGHFCDVGSSFYLQRLNGHIGKYMALTAHIFRAEDAVLSGLATHFIPSKRLEDLEEKLKNLEKPSHSMVNAIIEEFSVKSDHTYSSDALCKENRAIINNCFKHDSVEEIIQALEKDGSKFSLDTIEEINKGSPIGVKLTAELYRRTAGLSFAECLRLEHFLWQSSPFQPECQEGINTGVLKKQTPQWVYPDVKSVDMENDILLKYFYGNGRRTSLDFFTGRDHYKSENNIYKLPSERDVLHERNSSNFTSDKDFIEWFVKEKNHKFGIREQVEDVINRYGLTKANL